MKSLISQSIGNDKINIKRSARQFEEQDKSISMRYTVSPFAEKHLQTNPHCCSWVQLNSRLSRCIYNSSETHKSHILGETESIIEGLSNVFRGIGEC